MMEFTWRLMSSSLLATPNDFRLGFVHSTIVMERGRDEVASGGINQLKSGVTCYNPKVYILQAMRTTCVICML